MASALYGTVVGSLLGGWPADRFGRKATLLWIGVLYFVGAWGSALAPNVTILLLRASSADWASAFLPSSLPCTSRKSHPLSIVVKLAGMFQFNIVFGILIAYVRMRCSQAPAPMRGAGCWVWAAFPSFLYAVFCFGLPESPRWLLSRKDDRQAGMQVLQRIEPEASAGPSRSPKPTPLLRGPRRKYRQGISGPNAFASRSCSLS